MFFNSSATTNAFRSLSSPQGIARNMSFGQQPQQAKRPMRCPSPSPDSMEVERGVERQSSLMAPPRIPGRCQSPVNTPTTPSPQSMDVQRGVERQSSLMAPPRHPGRCESPITILPEPVNASELEDSAMISTFGMPAKRPARSASPVTVTPRSSFNFGQMEDRENM